MLKDFKAFVLRGNVLDLAVGIIVGGAFGKIVSSFVADVLMPPIGLIIGKVDFTNLFVSLNGQSYPSLAEAKKAVRRRSTTVRSSTRRWISSSSLSRFTWSSARSTG